MSCLDVDNSVPRWVIFDCNVVISVRACVNCISNVSFSSVIVANVASYCSVALALTS